MLVDSHVNLHGEQYAEDLEEVLTRAQEAGVGAMLAISDRLSSSDAIDSVIAGRANMWRSVGVHPHHAKEHTDLSADELIRRADAARIVGIGECGLDFHYEYSDREVQEPVFRAHVAAARETGLPLIIHTRNADDRMAEILEEEAGQGAFPLLLHCYTGGLDLMERALALGAYVAFSGIITFKKADDVRAAAQACPLDRVLVETDCPYLAPMPYRGRRNEPSYLVHVADRLAEIKGVSRETLEAATTDNFFTLFSKAQRP